MKILSCLIFTVAVATVYANPIQELAVIRSEPVVTKSVVESVDADGNKTTDNITDVRFTIEHKYLTAPGEAVPGPRFTSAENGQKQNDHRYIVAASSHHSVA